MWISGVAAPHASTHAADGSDVVFVPTIVGFRRFTNTTGTWANASIGGVMVLYASNNGDEVVVGEDIYIPAGTYSLLAMFRESNACGIAKVYLGATLVGTFDTYSVAAAIDGGVATGITIAAGKYDISVKIDGKNGSSSAYTVRLSQLEFVRTA